jgi:hypothetical protein
VDDLFEQSQELFCPLDGEKLSEPQPDRYGHDKYRICPTGHWWDVWPDHVFKGGLRFEPVRLARCPDCGKTVPKWEMRSDNGLADGRAICPACLEPIKQAWIPDLEKSHARLTISPIKRGEEVLYSYQTAVEIRPYPNPLGSGGCWGGGSVTTEAEVEEVIADFKRCNEDWERRGIKLEVIRHQEVTEVEYTNIRQVEEAEEKGEEVGTLRLL